MGVDFPFINFHDIEKEYPGYAYAVPLTNILGGSYWYGAKEAGCGIHLIPAPLFYVGGMIGFALSVPLKVIRVVGRIFLVLFSLINAVISKFDDESTNHLKNRSISLGVSCLKLLMVPLAILCPPAGYAIENKLNRLLPSDDSTFYFVVTRDPNELTDEQAYAILGLEVGASSKIKRAYKDLALVTHPDKFKETSEPVTIQYFENLFSTKGLKFHPEVYFGSSFASDQVLTSEQVAEIFKKIGAAYEHFKDLLVNLPDDKQESSVSQDPASNPVGQGSFVPQSLPTGQPPPVTDLD